MAELTKLKVSRFSICYKKSSTKMVGESYGRESDSYEAQISMDTKGKQEAVSILS